MPQATTLKTAGRASGFFASSEVLLAPGENTQAQQGR
ncbi:hypothetical protein A2U01_0080851, partial [Trifolium medium]|nr:hypothetical protein [Trifolium medium]